MKKLITIGLIALSTNALAAGLTPLPETAQDNGWNIRLVGVHYHQTTNQTEFYYRVRVEEGAAPLNQWQLKLKERFSGLELSGIENSELKWEKEIKPGSVELVSFKIPGERTTQTSLYSVESGNLIAEGPIDTPSFKPLASTPMTASNP